MGRSRQNQQPQIMIGATTSASIGVTNAAQKKVPAPSKKEGQKSAVSANPYQNQAIQKPWIQGSKKGQISVGAESAVTSAPYH